MNRILLLAVSSTALLTGFSQAQLVIDVYNVSGNNTSLAVDINGSGTALGSLVTFGANRYSDFSGTIDNSTVSVAFLQNIGPSSYVSSSYSDIGERFTSPITFNNLTDGTTANIL